MPRPVKPVEALQRSRSTDESSHRRPSSPAVTAPSRFPSAPVLLRAETFPRVSAAASHRGSQEAKEEFERRMFVCNGLMRPPSRSEPQTSSSYPRKRCEQQQQQQQPQQQQQQLQLQEPISSSCPKGPVPPSLSTLRGGQRAKKVEKMVHARAAMKQRLVDYCADKREQEIDDAGA